MPWNEVMQKWKHGSLRSGGNGAPVRSQKQAVAIMLDEKRKAEAGDKEYQPMGKTHEVDIGKGKSFDVKEGSLHRMLGIPEDEKIGQKRLEQAEHSRNPVIRRKAISGMGLTHMHSH